MNEFLKIEPQSQSATLHTENSLKSLLGIGKNSSTNPTPNLHGTATNATTGKPISLNALFAMSNFKKDTAVPLPPPPTEWTTAASIESSQKAQMEQQQSKAQDESGNKPFFHNNAQKWHPQHRFKTKQHVHQQQQHLQALNQSKSPVQVTASVNSFVPLQAARKSTKSNKKSTPQVQKPSPMKPPLPDVVEKSQDLSFCSVESSTEKTPEPSLSAKQTAVAVKKSRLALKFPVNN